MWRRAAGGGAVVPRCSATLPRFFEGATHFGTGLGCSILRTLKTPPAMLTPMKNYLKLKRQAMRQMLTGDVERYMQTLRVLNELRRAQTRGLA